MRKTKIVCTMGPSTDREDTLVEMIKAGMDAARLNFSHGNHEDHRRMLARVRRAAATVGRPVATLSDLCGPKIRLGCFADGQVELIDGTRVVLTPREILGDARLLPHAYGPLARDVEPGDPILLNDGLIRLRVEERSGEDVNCIVVVGGEVSNHKGMNLPTTTISSPALTAKDRQDLELAVELGLDYVALSFVRTADDVLETCKLAHGIPVIAKIEKPEAIENLAAILEAADGIMVPQFDTRRSPCSRNGSSKPPCPRPNR